MQIIVGDREQNNADQNLRDVFSCGEKAPELHDEKQRAQNDRQQRFSAAEENREQARKNLENICRVDVSDFKQRAFCGFPRYSLEAAFLAEQPAQRKNGTNSQEYLENSRGDQMLICLFFYKQISPCRIAFTRIFHFFV